MKRGSAGVAAKITLLLALLIGSLPAARPAVAAQARAAGTITVGMSQEPPNLGYGLGATVVGTTVKAAIGTQPPLTRQNDRVEWIPFLSENVPTIENGGATFVGDGADQRLQVVFNMRRDARWSDGVPVTGNDVRFAWQLDMNADYPVSDRTFEQKISSMEIVEDYQVVVGLMSQNEARDAAANGRMGLDARDFADFVNQEGPVVDPNYFKGYPAYPRHILQPLIDQVGVAGLPQHDIMRRPVGIGPFKLTEWAPGQFLATDAVPTFFLGAPRTQSIVFKIVSDTNALKAQLANGEVDVVTSDALNEFDAPDLDQMARQGLIETFYVPSTSWEHIDFNLDNKFLSDLRVRRAIAHAINRPQIVESVMNGKAMVIHSWSPTWRWDFNPDVTQYEFNPAKARDLLREAGYTPGPDGILRKDGQKLSLLYQTTTGNQARLLVSQIVQQNVKDVGIEIRLEYLPAAQFFAAGGNPGPLQARTFELGHYAWSAPDDPMTTKNLYSSVAIPSKENSFVGQNYPGFRDKRNDELLQAASNTLDRPTRTALYAEQQKLWADALPVLPLYARANVHATKAGFQGYRPPPTSTPPTWNAYEWQLP